MSRLLTFLSKKVLVLYALKKMPERKKYKGIRNDVRISFTGYSTT